MSNESAIMESDVSKNLDFADAVIDLLDGYIRTVSSIGTITTLEEIRKKVVKMKKGLLKDK